MIAAGEHPVPIDLETILHAAADEHKANEPEEQAFDAATEIVANSVMTVGLLPAYGRSPDNNIFAIGGVTSDWNSKTKLTWDNINSDEMRPAKSKETPTTTPNLPHVNGRYVKFGDHIDAFVAGFEDYAKFLLHQPGRKAGRTVRRLCWRSGPQGRSRRRAFLGMLLQRLKDHRTMDDGIVWSAQADFIARLTDWDNTPIRFGHCSAPNAQRSSRSTCRTSCRRATETQSPTRPASGVQTAATSGLERAHARVRSSR